jgi:pimeloyl-ACP methyl ester carboxylesterase
MDSVSCSRSGGLRRVARIGRQLAALPSLSPAARVAVGDDGLASIHYETHGNPAHPALFLAHGAGGNSAVWWRNVPYLVARGYFVITHDAR